MAVLVAALPPGSLVWRVIGGPASWSPADRVAAQVAYWGQVADWRLTKDGHENRNPPQPPEPPRPTWEIEAEEAALEEMAAAKAAERARRDALRAQLKKDSEAAQALDPAP